MIDRIFSTEGPVYRVLDKMGQMVVASVLWMLGCMPIVTIATSTTAFYYAIIKVVRRERGTVAREFWQSYKANLTRGIVTTITALVPAGLLAYNIYLLHNSDLPNENGLMWGYIMVMAMLGGFCMYICPVLSRFSVNVISAWKLAFLMMLGVAACGGSNESKDSSSTNNPINTSSTQISNNSSNTNISTGKKTMEHVNFPDVEVVYDGNSHTIEASVYPDGSTVTYLDNGPFVDVGEYVIRVRISHPDYEDYEDTATLVIKAATMSTISFEDSTLTFDGEPHTIEATGFPEDAVVTYTNNGPFTNVGEYEIKVRIELANYEPYEETKTLVIEAADMDENAI